MGRSGSKRERTGNSSSYAKTNELKMQILCSHGCPSALKLKELPSLVYQNKDNPTKPMISALLAHCIRLARNSVIVSLTMIIEKFPYAYKHTALSL